MVNRRLEVHDIQSSVAQTKYVTSPSGGGVTRWHSMFRHCATSWKVAGSTPDVVIGIFH